MIDVPKKITVLLTDDLHERLVISGVRRGLKLQGLMVEAAEALLSGATAPSSPPIFGVSDHPGKGGLPEGGSGVQQIHVKTQREAEPILREIREEFGKGRVDYGRIEAIVREEADRVVERFNRVVAESARKLIQEFRKKA